MDETGERQFPGCTGNMPGTLLHLATGQCPIFGTATAAAAQHWVNFLQVHSLLLPLVQVVSSGSPEQFLSMLLDPSTQAPVIFAAQEPGPHVVDQLYYLIRTWLFTLDKERLQKLGHWTPG